MYSTTSDLPTCLGMCFIYTTPSARVSLMPRGKLEKPLLKQELLFISDQHSKFSASLTLMENLPLDQPCLSCCPLNKDWYVFITNSRAMSVMCHKPQNSLVLTV